MLFVGKDLILFHVDGQMRFKIVRKVCSLHGIVSTLLSDIRRK